jgi:hypothetical protein
MLSICLLAFSAFAAGEHATRLPIDFSRPESRIH